MLHFPLLLFLLKLNFQVSSFPLTGAESLGSLILSVPTANDTHSNSTIAGYARTIYYSPCIQNTNSRLNIREMTGSPNSNPEPFHIENSTVTLLICEDPNLRMDETALRNTLFDAYTFVTNLIDIAGDGNLPASSDPYEVETEGVYIKISSDRIDPKRLRWSNVKDTLWSLREYMVIEGHSFQTAFVIMDAQGTDTLGFGRLLKSKPSIDITKAIKGRRISRTLSCT